MDTVATLEAPCAPEVLFPLIADLGRYPEWLSIVPRAEALAVDDEAGPAWMVDLRGRLGPLSRSKRLRMVRTEADAPRAVRFERQERDGRRHSPWTLTGIVEPTDGGCRLTMTLHYGGSLWGPMLERMLGDEIDKGSQRLLALAAA